MDHFFFDLSFRNRSLGVTFFFILKILRFNRFILPNVRTHIQSNETISSHTATGVETLLTNFNVFVCK